MRDVLRRAPLGTAPDRATRRRRPGIGPIGRSAVWLRRLFVRRPWLYWVLVAGLASAVAGEVLSRHDDVELARNAWGREVSVWIAAVDHAPGDRLDVVARRVPAALTPPSAVTELHDVGARVARQRITAGEIVTIADTAVDGPLALAPAGWLVVPVVESPPSGAMPGERVVAVSEGVVLADEALVVGFSGEATLVAVPSRPATQLPVAGNAGTLTLLRRP